MRARRDGVAFGVAFGSQLLEPEDWFAYIYLPISPCISIDHPLASQLLEPEDWFAFWRPLTLRPTLTLTLTLRLTVT